jgi:hypothetical protein
MSQAMNAPVTSAVELETRRAAIVACFVFQREIGRHILGLFRQHRPISDMRLFVTNVRSDHF